MSEGKGRHRITFRSAHILGNKDAFRQDTRHNSSNHVAELIITKQQVVSTQRYRGLRRELQEGDCRRLHRVSVEHIERCATFIIITNPCGRHRWFHFPGGHGRRGRPWHHDRGR